MSYAAAILLCFLAVIAASIAIVVGATTWISGGWAWTQSPTHELIYLGLPFGFTMLGLLLIWEKVGDAWERRQHLRSR